ncbi:N-acetylglucosamine-6-phosphate deacetylase [Orbus wheelerorum]|uniref:N-acetylglucosamine-6-phosphate deacetylase n=1 Tax=Orbus wheelerorum TaxID=3074111 RepID=UPI00370D267D
MEYKKIHAQRILTEIGWLENGLLTIDKQGIIIAIEQAKSPSPNNLTIMPALIDSHIHGAKGMDVMDASHQALNTISLYLAEHGVGAFLATTVTDSTEKIEAALVQIKQSYQQGVDGAQLLGAYLEGPFFTAKHKGAHPQNLLQAPARMLLERWLKLADGTLKCIALAPEYLNSLSIIRWLRLQNIRVMLGHTNANYQTIKSALTAGASGVVHCYNGMQGLHHREPGAVGAAFTSPNCQTEIIADGYHVHHAAINIAHRCCNDQLLLISDAMRAAGMPNGDYKLGEMNVHMQNNVVRTDDGGLAGSTLSLDVAVNHLANAANIAFEQAWLHASIYVANALGIGNVLGSIRVGKQANLVLLTPQKQIIATLVNGNTVYKGQDHDNYQLC